MKLEELRNDIIVKQKKGLPFITTSVIIWILITIVTCLNVNQQLENILIFSCSCPLMPLAWCIGKKMDVDIFSKENPLGEVGFLFTLNQLLYLLIVMWVFNALPEKMLMVFAMVFGAHLLPYSWLYKSGAYRFFSILIPILSLVVGNIFSTTVLSALMVIIEIVFALLLHKEVRETETLISVN
ncbi:hypothetical protein SAMN02910293_01833 [Streptococcus henryi]|jgi:hypothetical protein|uniref:Uncharacterized protein n=1 Tax=Streptococcus henryi TaxID=439219 RepID=A0A1G6CWL7_9STRE|nr:hypothetical protein [Streptococcus henryi]SDB37065.1 hypothetical protein SAMN02910293_01833 [Streptococcus henryi]